MCKMNRLRWSALLLILLSPAMLGAGGQSTRMPEIVSKQWLNSAPLTTAGLRGKVVLVEFWTFGCWNCGNVEPYIKRWHKKYKDEGLVVIAVHTPEFDYERKLNKLRNYLREHDIQYPVAVDNDSRIWHAYRNWAWPTIYLVGKRGHIRYKRIGEGGYAETEKVIGMLLEE